MRERSRFCAGGLVLLLVASCGLASCVIKFKKNGRPCTKDNQCLPGFSCMVNRCIKDHSIPEGQTCFVNDLCQPGLRCVVPAFVCRKPCSKPFSPDADCPAGRACVRMTDTTGAPLAACTASECSTTCVQKNHRDQSCVKITANVGVCLDACQVTCATTGSGTSNGTNSTTPPMPGPQCKGNCLFASNNAAQSCQPLGPNGTLACLEEQSSRRQGQPCNQIDELCARGYACVQPKGGGTGVCLAYCDPTSTDPCPDLTDPATQQQATCLADGNVNVCGSVPTGPVNACTSAEKNETRCSGDEVQTCDGSQWNDTTNCGDASKVCEPQSTASAACVPPCTANDTRCDASGTVVQACDSDGHWTQSQDCSASQPPQVCGGSTTKNAFTCITPCTINGFTPTTTTVYFDPDTLGVHEVDSSGTAAHSKLVFNNLPNGASDSSPSVSFSGTNASPTTCTDCLSASRDDGNGGTEYFIADAGRATFDTPLPAQVGDTLTVTLAGLHMRQVDSSGNDVAQGDTWCVNSLTFSGTTQGYSCSDPQIENLDNGATLTDGDAVCVFPYTSSAAIWTCTSGTIALQQRCTSGCSATNALCTSSADCPTGTCVTTSTGTGYCSCSSNAECASNSCSPNGFCEATCQ